MDPTIAGFDQAAIKEMEVEQGTTIDLQHVFAPHPVQIMNFQSKLADKPLTVVCYEDRLKSILDKTGNRPVAILAVVGPTRQGKSFFLNFILRRLIGTRDEKEDWMGWNQPNEPLLGFAWKANDVPVTEGIWMWSEPFTLKSKSDGSEYDILLMDTQGMYDDDSGKREWSTLMGLSLLTSSCLVYNLTHNINKKDLEMLDTFLSFGVMALKDQNDAGQRQQSPFQSLVFLVRDWNNPGQFPYGSEGGHKFIQKKLHETNRKNDSSDVRDKFEKCFDKISCILLPHPGPDVIELEYDGCIGNCQKFATAVESAVEDILFLENLPVKQINGNTVTGKDILELFKTTTSLFNDNQMLTSESIYFAVSKAWIAAVVQNCVSNFIHGVQSRLQKLHFVRDADLEDVWNVELKRIINVFNNSRKMGERALIDEAAHNLYTELQKEFFELKSNCLIKQEDILKSATSKSMLKYESVMESVLKDIHFLPQETFARISKAVENEALNLFKSLLKLQKDDNLTVEKVKFFEAVRTKFQEFQTVNNDKKAQAEKILEDVDNFCKSYEDTILTRTGGRILSEEKLHTICRETSSSITGEFTQKYEASPFLRLELQRLTDRLNVARKQIEKEMKLQLKEVIERLNELSSKSFADYNQKMLKVSQDDLTELIATHQSAKSAAIKILTESNLTPKEMIIASVNKLETKINNVYTDILSSFNKTPSSYQQEISAALQEAHTKYKAAVMASWEGPWIPSYPSLESRHESVKFQTLHYLEGALQKTCPRMSTSDINQIRLKFSDSLDKMFPDIMERIIHKASEEAKKKFIEGGFIPTDTEQESEDKPVKTQDELNQLDKSIIWTKSKATGLIPRSEHAAAAVGKTIYSFGGLSTSGHPSYSFSDLDISVLNVAKSEKNWKLVSAKSTKTPYRRISHSAVAYNEFVYIFGGFEPNEMKLLNSTLRFNTETFKWEEVKVSGNIPAPRQNHTAVVVQNLMIVFGGRRVSNESYSLNLKTFSWSKIKTRGAPPSRRHEHSATVYKDRFIFIFGGNDIETDTRLNDLFCFDVNSKRWTQPKIGGTVPCSRRGHSAFVQNGLVFIFGGSPSRDSDSNDLFSYNPENCEWKEVKPMGQAPSPRSYCEAVAVDDRVFLFGGYNKKDLDETFILEMVNDGK